MSRRKDISNNLREAIVIAVNLGRVTRPFPNNSKSIQRGTLFTSGKHSRQFPIFPGVDVPANSPQGDLRLYRPHLTC